MKYQGYKFKRIQLMQDYMSTIKIEKNGQNSCPGNYRQINIRYFFVKDGVNKRILKLFIFLLRLFEPVTFKNHYREGYFI